MVPLALALLFILLVHPPLSWWGHATAEVEGGPAGFGGHVEETQRLAATQQFFADFFPSLHALMEAHLPPGAVNRLLGACPEQSVALVLPFTTSTVHVRNPWLLPFQLMGVWVGLAGYRRLGRLKPAAQRHRHAYLQHGLLFFAGMNAVSILCHVVLARENGTWLAAKALDVGFTGAASACATLAALLPGPRSQAAAAGAAGRCAHVLVTALSAAAAGELLQLPWVPEFTYLGSILVAVAATTHRTFLPTISVLATKRGHPRAAAKAAATIKAVTRARQARALVLASAALAFMLACLPLDGWMCRLLGSSALGTTPLLFLGSDLAFLSLLLLATASDTQERGKQ